METVHSFIRFMGWVDFQKLSQDYAQSTEELTCWILKSMKYLWKAEKSQEFAVETRQPRLLLWFVILVTWWTLKAKAIMLNLLEKLSELFAWWIIQSLTPTTPNPSRSFFQPSSWASRLVSISHFYSIRYFWFWPSQFSKTPDIILFLDTYISMVSYSHLICAAGFYVAIVSGTVETEAPE